MDDFDFTLSRTELLAVLSDFGVTITKDSKLPDQALHKRLVQALDATQATPAILPKAPVSVKKLIVWPAEHKVYDFIRRVNVDETGTRWQAKMRGEADPMPLYQNAFRDMRQTIWTITENYDQGTKAALIQDRKFEKSAVVLRVVGVCALNPETPLVLVLFTTRSKSSALSAVHWALEQPKKADGGAALGNIMATDLEQKLLLQTLKHNSKYLSADYQPNRTKLEHDFKLSFLVPVAPLSQLDLGKLNSDHGCAVCGERSTKRCSQCQSAAYCSSVCQKADWPSHKQACRSLKGGTWLTLPFITKPPGLEGRMAVNMNRLSTESRRVQMPEAGDTTPPQNIHGEKVFMVKIQLSTNPWAPGSLLIYDRQRSFTVWVLESADWELFDVVKNEIQGPRGGYFGMKMYRWAKRAGDLELSVCLDREPKEEIKW